MTERFIDEIYSHSKDGIIKRNIINYYINNGEASIADLGKEINVSVPTATKFINELIEGGYVIDYGKQETSGGRRPNIYGLNQDSAYFVGVDLSLIYMNIGTINFSGNLVNESRKIPYRIENSSESFQELCKIISSYIDGCGIAKDKILNVAINLSGRVNTNSGQSYSYFYFDERPLTKIFEEQIGIPTSIDNDSRAMTYGEYMSGGANSEKNILFINATWGLGMGIIIDGKLYYGKSGFSGEFGHHPTFDNEILCHCGKKGCLETEVSGYYIHKIFMERLKEGCTSILTNKYERNENISLSDIVNAALQDDMLAIELIEEVGSRLGKATAGLINIFNPDLVIVGGTLAEAEDYLMLPLISSVKKHSLTMVHNDTRIRCSKLGNKVGMIGACMLARSKTLGLL